MGKTATAATTEVAPELTTAEQLAALQQQVSYMYDLLVVKGIWLEPDALAEAQRALQPTPESVAVEA